MLLFRMIHKIRWDPAEDPPWVPPGDIPADPLYDLRTTDNAISVWLVENDHSNLDRIAAAFSAKRDDLGCLDYVLFDEAVVEALGLRQERASGDTPDQEANESWHRDIVELSATRLVELAKGMYRQGTPDRFGSKQIGELIAAAVRSNQIRLDDLEPDLRNKIAKRL